jgi:hypothetical protein
MFFAYGSTLVVEGKNGREETYQGNSLVHMYGHPLPPEANAPDPPPQDQTQAARIQLSLGARGGLLTQ